MEWAEFLHFESIIFSRKTVDHDVLTELHTGSRCGGVEVAQG